MGSRTKLGLNVEINEDNKASTKDLTMFKSPQNDSRLTLLNDSQFHSPSVMKLRNRDFGASELGGLISSPTGSMFKTTYKIKAGSFTKAERKN